MFLSLSELMSAFYFRFGYKEYGRDEHPRDFEVPYICTLIKEVRLFDSAAIVYKGKPRPPMVFKT